MAAIVTTVQVDRPADEVFAYATDPTRFKEWQQGVVDGYLESHGTPTVGTSGRSGEGAGEQPDARATGRSAADRGPGRDGDRPANHCPSSHRCGAASLRAFAGPHEPGS